MAPSAFRVIGTFLNVRRDRLVTAEVHSSGHWTIKGGGHLCAPLYASGTAPNALFAVRDAAERLEDLHEAAWIKGDTPRDIHWHIDIDRYRAEA